jgi:hypothetical protein
MKCTRSSVSVAALLLCVSCQAAIRKEPGETVTLRGEDLSGVSESALEEKIARDLVAVRHVIQGLAALEQHVTREAALLGDRATRSYTQDENDRIRALLQSYLNYRSVLLRLLGYHSSFETVGREDLRLKSFLLAYVSGLILYREGILLVTTFRARPLARAKLNEPEPVWGIPPDIFETVYSNITSLTNVQLVGEAWDFYTAQAPRMAHHGLVEGSEFGWLHDTIRQQQQFIEANAVNIWAGKWDILWRRLGLLRRLPTYNAAAIVGTFASQTKVWISRPLISREQVQELKGILQPGDIILERRNWYLSNGFLPGYWPHMALYVGTAADLERRGLATHPLVQPHLERYRQPDRNGFEHRAIEAVVWGVISSSLEETAAADQIAVLRPRVSEARKDAAIARAFSHYGKPYDFDFDFFSTDRLACTELVFRAYDEFIAGERIGFPLVRILGRDTLPPDEIVRMVGREYALDRLGEAAGLPPMRQLDFVLFLDGNFWTGRAPLANLERFFQSAERPARGPAAEERVREGPGS